MRPLIDIFSRSCRNVAWPRSFVRSPPFPSPVLLLLADLAFAPPFSILRSPRPRSIESFRFLLLLVLFSFFLLGPALAVQRPRTKRAPNICADPRNLTTLIPSKLLPSSFERRNPALVDRRSYISIVTALLLLVRSSSDEDDAANLKFLGFDETRGREVFRWLFRSEIWTAGETKIYLEMKRFWVKLRKILDIYSLLLLFFLISIVEFTKIRKIFYPWDN